MTRSRIILLSSVIFTLRMVLLSGVCFSQIAAADHERISNDILSFQFPDGQKTILFDDSTVCRFSTENGFIHGPWRSYYPDGRLKAKGQFQNNSMAGKWKVFSPWGKRFLVLDYGSGESYRLRRVRSGFLKNPVLFGRGKVHYTAYGTTDVDSAMAYNGKVHYRHGQKHGNVKEYSLQGKILAEYSYHEGQYDGKYVQYYNSSGSKLEAEFENGVPKGRWTFSDHEKKYTVEDFYADPYRQRVPRRGYINNWEVLFNKRKIKVIHHSHPSNTELFEPDSSGVDVYTMLNNAFIQGETVFYTDDQLSEPVFPSASKPALIDSELILKKNAKPVMLIYSEYSYYSLQLSDLRNMPLVCSIVFSYDTDEGKPGFVSTPFFYFPETYAELSEKNFQDKTFGDVLLNILHKEYFSVAVYFQNERNGFVYESRDGNTWIEESVRKELELINMTHDLWMYQTGVIY